MDLWNTALLGTLFACGLVTPYCLACLWKGIKASGLLDIHQERSTGSCFVLLQEMVEPRIKHVMQMKERMVQRSEGDRGEGAPPEAD